MAIVGSVRKTSVVLVLWCSCEGGGYFRKSGFEALALVPRHSQLATVESDPVQDAI
jgi:hypothetical protein